MAACILAFIIGGGYWMITNGTYSECQSIFVQAAASNQCSTVLTFHTPAGFLALLAAVAFIIAVVRK
jgi:hypothetical protein